MGETQCGERGEGGLGGLVDGRGGDIYMPMVSWSKEHRAFSEFGWGQNTCSARRNARLKATAAGRSLASVATEATQHAPQDEARRRG